MERSTRPGNPRLRDAAWTQLVDARRRSARETCGRGQTLPSAGNSRRDSYFLLARDDSPGSRFTGPRDARHGRALANPAKADRPSVVLRGNAVGGEFRREQLVFEAVLPFLDLLEADTDLVELLD